MSDHYSHLNPGGRNLPQALTNKLSESGILRLIPRTLALMAVHRQAATSKSTKPSSNEQHLFVVSGVPTTTLTRPRTSAQTPSFSVSLGQEGVGFTGGTFGVQVLHALETVTVKMRKKMKILVAELAAMANQRQRMLLGLISSRVM
ncbi:hypothetical protein L1987_09992 [Smallanthus sonchifolius]|uniref:Uncharacterized protein n=1 Tax=Smallanthus sonchifolius TaxID=185202 RepID=A0ACB9JQV9_9ASTR|nr:hypothetical protein L1987_09992 [Smallanthus sonchifolius]